MSNDNDERITGDGEPCHPQYLQGREGANLRQAADKYGAMMVVEHPIDSLQECLIDAPIVEVES